MSPPFEEKLSDRVRGRYGFKDAHVEIEIDLPKPLSLVKKVYREKFTLEEARRLKRVLDEVVRWGDLAPEERERMGAP